MVVHIHICYYCERTEEVEGINSRVQLPEDWHWKVQRRKGENAVAVCPKCWSENLLEIVLGRRARGRRLGGVRGGCCG